MPGGGQATVGSLSFGCSLMSSLLPRRHFLKASALADDAAVPGRIAEAMYPLLRLVSQTGRKRYLDAAQQPTAGPSAM